MANEKKVFSASDAAPVVLYAKTDPASELAYPVTSTGGSLTVNVTYGTITFDNTSIEQITGEAHNTYNIAVAGMDTAGNVQPLKTDTDRDVQVDVLSSALPTGAATETTLGSVKTSVEGISGNVTSIHEKINTLNNIIAAIRSTIGIASDLRVTLLSGTVTTVSSVTNLASIGSINANMQVNALMNLAYLQSNHLNITRS